MKRYRISKPKPNELKVQYGKIPNSNLDICYLWGCEINKSDSHMMHRFLNLKQFNQIDSTRSKSFIEELTDRGYDIKTLKISIMKMEN